MISASPTTKAIAWMMGALTSFAVMTVSVRELTGEMHAFQMLFIRSAIGILILLPFLQRGGWGQIRLTYLAGHGLRNVIHFTGQVLWIFGIGLLPLATVSALEFTSPLWGGLLAVLFLGEKMNRGRWTAFGLGFLGVLVIVRPGFIEVSEGILIMLACAFFFGATGVATKWLTRRESALAIVFMMVVMQTVFGAVASSFVWAPLAWHQAPWLILLAVTGLTAHYSLTRALAAADATFIMPMEFLRLPIVAVVGFLLYQEAFEAMTLLGAAIIFSGNYASIRHETRTVVR
ncbi:DMT family transporter [Pelagibius sp.]|uniref:DMT family transporter n=1 Tax=Pelagibius sp. TaxID=1931238 RepID=UPI003B50BB3E